MTEALLHRAQAQIETQELQPRVAAIRELEALLDRHFPPTADPDEDIAAGSLASRTAIAQMLLGRVLATAVEQHGLAEVLPLVEVLGGNLEEVMMSCLREVKVS